MGDFFIILRLIPRLFFVKAAVEFKKGRDGKYYPHATLSEHRSNDVGD